MKSASFIEQCLCGKAGPEDIDDFIDEWHEGNTGIPLWQFLGMTREEYGRWVENQDVLPVILFAHRFPGAGEGGRSLALVARSMPEPEVEKVRQWLERREADSA